MGLAQRVAVIGPGAIGLAVGAAAIEAGTEVTFCARTLFNHLEVTHPTGVVSTPATVVTDAEGLSAFAFVLLATKIYDTPQIQHWLDALVGEGTVLAVLQNGVTHNERIAPLVHENARVLPVVVRIPARRTGPGVVVVPGVDSLIVPESVAGQQFAELLNPSYLPIVVTDDWTTAAWEKLALNATAAVGVITQRSNAVYLDPEAGALQKAIIEETAAVARAEGANLSTSFESDLYEWLQEQMTGDGQPSITTDRIAGNPTEWRDRNYVVVERAAKHGIPVPVSTMLSTLLRLGEPT